MHWQMTMFEVDENDDLDESPFLGPFFTEAQAMSALESLAPRLTSQYEAIDPDAAILLEGNLIKATSPNYDGVFVIAVLPTEGVEPHVREAILDYLLYGENIDGYPTAS